MKKALSLILSVLMLLSCFVTVVSAAGPVVYDFRDSDLVSDMIPTKLSDSDAKPQQDGQIGVNEYTMSRSKSNVEVHNKSTPYKVPGADDGCLNYDYFAFDDNYLYLGFSVQEYTYTGTDTETPLDHFLNLGISAHNTLNHNSDCTRHTFKVTVTGEATAPTVEIGNVFGAAFRVITKTHGMTTDDVTCAAVFTPTEGKIYGTAVYELKIDIHKLGQAFGLVHMYEFGYILTMNNYINYNKALAADAANSEIYGYSVGSTDVYDYVPLRAEYSSAIDAVRAGISGYTNKYNITWCGYHIFLGNEGVQMKALSSAFDIKSSLMWYDGGLISNDGTANDNMAQNVFLGNGTKTAVVNGEIGVDEYQKSVTRSTSTAVEYFAYDDDYVYFAYVKNGAASTHSMTMQFTAHPSVNPGSPCQRLKITIALAAAEENGCTVSFGATDGYSSYAMHFSKNTAALTNPTAYAKYDSSNQIATYEFKMAKSDICDAFAIESFNSIAYRFNVEDEWTLAGDAKAQTNTAGQSRGWTFSNVFYQSQHNIISGASVRLSPTHSGLRFATELGIDYVRALSSYYGTNITFGTLIAPTDKLNGKLTHASGVAGVDYLDVVADIDDPFNWDGDTFTLAGSITNIHPKNLTRKFTGVGYIKIVQPAVEEGDEDTVIYIYTDEVSRSVSEVASAALADPNGGYSEGQIKILKDLAGVA